MIRFDETSILDLILTESIFEIKCGDEKQAVSMKFKGIKSYIIKKRNGEELISFGNLEFCFYKNRLESFHIEKDKPNSKTIVKFEDLDEPSLRNILSMNNFSYVEDNGVFFLKKGKISLTLVNGFLGDVIILDRELFD